MFVIAGAIALIGAFAIYGFPNLRDGHKEEVEAERPKLVYRKPYRYYYYLNLLDGGRQQIFFSFGLFVLVDAYGMSVWEISALLICVRLIGIFSSTWIGSMIDSHGERTMLGFVNFGYIFRSRRVRAGQQCLSCRRLLSGLLVHHAVVRHGIGDLSP